MIQGLCMLSEIGGRFFEKKDSERRLLTTENSFLSCKGMLDYF